MTVESFVDYGIIAYNLGEIKKNTDIPFQIANKEIAKELFPYVQNIYPSAEMHSYGLCQWFVVSKPAKEQLKLELTKMISLHKKSIYELENIINLIGD